MSNSAGHHSNKPNLDRILTIYGRNAVLEALENTSLKFHAVHMADSNKSAKVLDRIIASVEQRNIQLHWHGRDSLSRISKNRKQDQGVAADIILEQFKTLNELLSQLDRSDRNPQYIALDGVTNPQNLGMIIRSVAASGIDGLILPHRHCADLGPLAIKASAGAVFRCPIVRCETIEDCLDQVAGKATVCALTLEGEQSFGNLRADRSRIFVLGNETEGVRQNIIEKADERLSITMANGVESLNVAVTAALLAFKVAAPTD